MCTNVVVDAFCCGWISKRIINNGNNSAENGKITSFITVDIPSNMLHYYMGQCHFSSNVNIGGYISNAFLKPSDCIWLHYVKFSVFVLFTTLRMMNNLCCAKFQGKVDIEKIQQIHFRSIFN